MATNPWLNRTWGGAARPQNPWVNRTWGGAQKQVAAAAPPSPPPPPPTPAPPPIDPAFEAYKVSAARGIQFADADAAYQNVRLDNLYGLGADKSNPYNQANLLMDNYRRQERGTMNSYAAQGQLYGTAYKRAQDDNKRNYNISFDQLSRDYNDARYDISRGQLEAYVNNGIGVDQERFNSLLRGLGK